MEPGCCLHPLSSCSRQHLCLRMSSVCVIIKVVLLISAYVSLLPPQDVKDNHEEAAKVAPQTLHLCKLVRNLMSITLQWSRSDLSSTAAVFKSCCADCCAKWLCHPM